MEIENYYHPLLNSFDCFGWIPTIRGSLSLDLLDQNLLLGDIDKYLIEFQDFQGFESSRYIVGSSLNTYVDRKHKKNFRSRSFRFFFRGSINDQNDIDQFINSFEDKAPITRLIQEKELLLGKLSIILNLSKKLNDSEAGALIQLSNLQNFKDRYQQSFVEDAVSLDELSRQRKIIKQQYDSTIREIKALEDVDHDLDDFRVWKFQVVLSRDGLLFFRNDTSKVFLKDFYEKETARDYNNNIQIHRIFKIALTYVKYQFHKHYHHDNKNDSFLPVTNLHKANAENDIISRIINQQLEKFLQQITKYKRLDKKLRSNPLGITNYAKSFTDILYYNGFIPLKKRNKLLDFIKYQETEANVYLRDYEKTRDFFLTQKNFIAAFTVGLSLVLVIMAILRFYFSFSNSDPQKLAPGQIFLIGGGAFTLGFILQRLIVTIKLSRYFISGVSNQKKPLFRFLFWDSNLKRKRLSLPYRLNLWLTQMILKLGKIWVNFIVIILTTTVIVLIVKLAIQLIGKPI